MGVHEDKLDLKKGEVERRNSTNIDSFFHQKRDAVYLSENKKMGYEKYFEKQQVRKSWKSDSGQILILNKQENLRFHCNTAFVQDMHHSNI